MVGSVGAAGLRERPHADSVQSSPVTSHSQVVSVPHIPPRRVSDGIDRTTTHNNHGHTTTSSITEASLRRHTLTLALLVLFATAYVLRYGLSMPFFHGLGSGLSGAVASGGRRVGERNRGLEAIGGMDIIDVLTMKSMGEKGLSPTSRTVGVDSILFAVISSAKTFDRVEKYVDVWRTADTRLTVWVDELPNKIPQSLSKFTAVSGAMSEEWWKLTKKDFHTRLAFTIVDAVRHAEKNQLAIDWFVVTDDDTIWVCI